MEKIKKYTDDENKWTGTHVSGPYNSTEFTDCCGVAVCDFQPRCPLCNRKVHGNYQNFYEDTAK